MKRNAMLIAMAMLVFLMGTKYSYSLEFVTHRLPGDAPTNSTGTGNLDDLVTAACKVWKLAFPYDKRTVILDYGWAPVGGGQHALDSQGGTPNLETKGTILFNNNNNLANFSWYLDPTPLECSEGTNTSYTEESVSLGDRSVNSTRCHRWSTSGPQMDLLTAVMHEIGHSLGMSYGNVSFIDECTDGDIDFTSGHWDGMVIPLQYNFFGVVSHISYVSDRTLMSGSYAPGERVWPSVLDMISLAELSDWSLLNLYLFPMPSMGQPYIQGETSANVIDVRWIQPIPVPAGMRYQLQSCTDMNRQDWVAVTNTVINVHGDYKVTVPFTTTNNMFFRMAVVPLTEQSRLLVAPATIPFTKNGLRSLDLGD